MMTAIEQPVPLFIKTPLTISKSMNILTNPHEVYLKMESSQLTGSFKSRGIGYHASKAVERGCNKLVGCSGGNAGLALAYAAKALKVPCSIYVPTTTNELFIDKLKAYGAEVIVHGANFSISNERAMKELEAPGVAFIHPYDHPEIWEGHSTLVQELAQQMTRKPSVIVTSVGGGGLICGILHGLQKVGWTDVPVLAMETLGAHCFNLSVKANKIVPLEEITSIAKTLGARTVPEHLLELTSKFNILSEVVTDAEAVSSCLKFKDDENVVVEPSCGAALAAVYFGTIERLVKEQKLELDGPVLIVVCGGSGATLEMLKNWAKELGGCEHSMAFEGVVWSNHKYLHYQYSGLIISLN